ncbi:glycosyltransferase [Myxococcus sp. RHSTA-1-4]|uniref:glycosyltransferase n=1 Tax=Myxococcus sp. RHSTA-1-4 TaxID=2874601 RepID=UPI001CBE93ED|nr:glycosyltransferase [Myxococcus sp. RHSTA-1-4]MBZ4417831.1 glycosyltransferase [Myxococcus sp. RHSTA-1-4]
MRNTFACLVHESRECVIDLVRNLHHLDPDSRILLYNGGQDGDLLQGFPFERYNAVVHPTPRPMKWGWLHDFALDCFRFALEHHPFDAMTIVDSDQLGLRPGYSGFLRAFLDANPGAGLLGNVQPPHGPGSRAAPAVNARREVDLWRPFLRRFPQGEAQFVHWTFWPSTVFTADAAKDMVTLWEDPQLQDILRRSRIWASEEVLFPTLVALLGHRVLTSPCSYDLVRYRVRYSTGQLDTALADPSGFWAHPIPRRYDDPLRAHVRSRFRDYEGRARVLQAPPPAGDALAPKAEDGAPVEGAAANTEEHGPRLLLTWPILAEMQKVEGWLSEEEADLLIAAASRALSSLPAPHAVVEVGSYCGKATVVLGRVAESLGSPAPIHAIDPGDGVVGSRDSGLRHLGPTRDKLQQTLRQAGLDSRVRVHFQAAPSVPWSEPIGFLLVDGLHDYASVAADFHHLEPWLATGGFVAFHDCADYFPGVKLFVRELLRGGRFRRVHMAGSLVVLEKVAAEERTDAAAAPPAAEPPALVGMDPTPTAPRARVTLPAGAAGTKVSCIMPTYNRRRFVPLAVRWFLAQDWPDRELIVVDDGSEPAGDLLPEDPRIRHVRLERRHSLGAKRNLACQAARGDVIVHWDDDDWSAPTRLTYQVSSLLQAGAAVCGLTRVYYHQPSTGRSWQYVYPTGQRPWVSGNTLCYTRDFWRRNPFPDINVGEDARFLWSDPSRTLLVLEDSSFFVACVHDANVDPKRVHHRFWHSHPTEALRALMGDAFDALRGAALPTETSHAPRPLAAGAP